MINKIYSWFHNKTSKAEERGEYSAGYWQDKIRTAALGLCRHASGKLLEVGCGEGLFLAKLAQANNSNVVYGIDISEGLLRKAKARFTGANIKNAAVSKADATSLPFEDLCFDTVICVNVFFNLPSEESVNKSIQEIVRVCKTGGRIIFDIRNSLNPFLYVKYKLAQYYDETVRCLPLRTYRLRKIILYLEAHNCKVVEKVTIGFPSNAFAPIFVLAAIKK